jgi:hypothetical protein
MVLRSGNGNVVDRQVLWYATELQYSQLRTVRKET